MVWGQCYQAHGMKIPCFQIKMSVWQVHVASSEEYFWQIWIFFKIQILKEEVFANSVWIWLKKKLLKIISSRYSPMSFKKKKKAYAKKRKVLKNSLIKIIIIKLSISPELKMKYIMFAQKKIKYF